MRDIKFRAWDKKYCEWFGESSDDCLTYVGFHIFGECLTFCPPSVSHLKHLHLEQFTGLKDKNGKEIYEGDIVRCLHFIEGLNLKTHYLTHKIEWNQQLTGWYAQHKKPGKDGSCQLWVYFKNAKELEVIGNIHENPELLEK